MGRFVKNWKTIKKKKKYCKLIQWSLGDLWLEVLEVLGVELEAPDLVWFVWAGSEGEVGAGLQLPGAQAQVLLNKLQTGRSQKSGLGGGANIIMISLQIYINVYCFEMKWTFFCLIFFSFLDPFSPHLFMMGPYTGLNKYRLDGQYSILRHNHLSIIAISYICLPGPKRKLSVCKQRGEGGKRVVTPPLEGVEYSCS